MWCTCCRGTKSAVKDVRLIGTRKWIRRKFGGRGAGFEGGGVTGRWDGGNDGGTAAIMGGRGQSKGGRGHKETEDLRAFCMHMYIIRQDAAAVD